MKSIFYVLLTFTCLFITAYGFGQTRIFMKATDVNGNAIKGSSLVEGHTDEIEVLAFAESDQSCAIDPNSPGPRNCRALTGPWNFTMNIDKAIIELKRAMYAGASLSSVDVTFERSSDSGPAAYYKVHLEQAAITTISESAGGDIPTFYILLDPLKINWTYLTGEGPEGEKSFGWDREKQIPL